MNPAPVRTQNPTPDLTNFQMKHPGQNPLRRSFFVKLGCLLLLLETPPDPASAASLSPHPPGHRWPLGSGSCSCWLGMFWFPSQTARASKANAPASAPPVTPTALQPGLGLQGRLTRKPPPGEAPPGSGGAGRRQAHPNPAEALIIVEALVLTRQLPAQWDPKLPALRQKQEQGFSTLGISGRPEPTPNTPEGAARGLLQPACHEEHMLKASV